MSTRYVGEITLGDRTESFDCFGHKGFYQTVNYPTNTNLPDKQNWNGHCIWEDNGRIFKPVNQDAVKNLDNLVKELSKIKVNKVHKDGSRKCTSVKYAIQAHSEKFAYLYDN